MMAWVEAEDEPFTTPSLFQWNQPSFPPANTLYFWGEGGKELRRWGRLQY